MASKTSFYNNSGVTNEQSNAIDASVTNAEDSATQAAASAASAASDAVSASNLSASTEASKNASQTSADSASASASTATTKASEASASAVASEASKVASGNSSAASATSATSSANSATASATSATASDASKVAAQTAQTNAETAETNAETAETNAETAETNSQTAQAASEAARDASVVAKNASETAKTASETAQTASETAQTAAETAETNSANSATASANSATASANSASTASTKAAEAAASAASVSNAETNTASDAVAAANSAAAAATALDNFDDKYLGVKSSDPTVDNDGDALVQGALYFSSSSSAMQVYDGSNWIAASSSGIASLNLYEYTATANQTAFSGNDDNGNSMSFIAANLLVTMNGIILDPSDFTTSSGLTVTLDVGAAVGDVVNIYAFKSFQVADTVSATAGGTFIGAVTFNSNITAGGTVDGRDLAADGTKLDGIATSANNYVHPSAHPISFITGLQGELDTLTTGLGNVNTDLANDTTPQLGGDLASNGNNINFGDNDKAIFGAGDDLQIYHDGSQSYIDDAGTGRLNIRANDRLYLRDTDNSVYAVFYSGAGSFINHNGNTKLSTTSTGVDVTGTAVMDGLTVDGNVGIGTSSPSAVFDVRRGDADGKIAEFHQSSGYGFELSSSASVATITAGYNQAFTFETGTTATERMRIDSSGNVLVGTTSSVGLGGGSSNEGVLLSSSQAQVIIGTSNDTSLYLNRQTSDGEMLNFRKDGSTVGSIASNNGDRLAIGSSDTGLLFVQDADDIIPFNMSTGSGRDNAIDLGQSGNRFKDLYLSGGVKLPNCTLEDQVIKSNTFIFKNGAGTTEYGRFDSSGNLLVGKTTGAFATAGTKITSTGNVEITAASDGALALGRTGSDGYIQRFYKDSALVGSIGTNSSQLFIASPVSNDSGLVFSSGEIHPCTTTGAVRDNGIMLGASGKRFSDVYAVNFHGDGSNLTGVGGSTSYGAVGTYTSCYPSGTGSWTRGSTYAGSTLRMALTGVLRHDMERAFNGTSNTTSANLSGTWRAMTNGYNTSEPSYNSPSVLFVRIS